MIALLISAFIIGLAGSFHCVGMCGAIALSLPVQSLPSQQRNIGIVLYNIGRISTYSIIGILFGLIGRTFYLGGLQKNFSILIGITIIVYLCISYFNKQTIQPKFIIHLNQWVQKKLGRFITTQGLFNTYIIGLLNGLLPCGMVYFALAGALASGSIIKGTLFMTMFGIGTIPLMFLVSYFGVFVNVAIRNRVNTIMPYFMFFMGVLFVLRGLNLNIPFISPMIDNSNTRVISCH